MAPRPIEPDTVRGGTARLLLGYVGTAGFTAVLTFYLVRALGPREFGLFSLAMGIGSLLAIGADFGITASASRFLAERGQDRSAVAVLLASAVRFKLGVAGLVALATFALAGPIADAYDEPSLAWPLRAMAVAVLGHGLFTLYSGALIAMRRTSDNLRLVVAESVVECASSILLVALVGGAAAAAWGRAIGYAVGVGVAVLTAIRLLGSRSAAIHRRGTMMAEMGRYAGALLIVNGAYTLFYNLDVLLIGAILTPVAVGAFSAPLRLAALLQYPGLALTNSIAPRAARTPGSEPDYATVRTGVRLTIVIGAAIAAPVLAWSEPIVALTLGDEYGDSVGVLRAMAPFLYLQGLAIMLSVTVNYIGHARRRIPVAVAAVAVNAVIDLLLLEPLGVIAAAIGTSAGFAVYTAGHFLICRRDLRLEGGPLLLTAARSGLAGSAAAGVLVLFGTGSLSPVEWVFGGLSGAATFAAVLVLTREVSADQLRALRSE